MLIGLLWYIALLARLGVSVRIWSTSKLSQRYGYTALWLFTWSAVDLVRRVAATDGRSSWSYAQVWAWSAWPLLVLQCSAVTEIVHRSAWQFRKADRGFVAKCAAWLSAVLLAAGIASVCWLEAEHIRLDKPLFVQITIAAARVVNLSSALSLVAAAITLWLLHSGRVSANLRASIGILAGYLSVSAGFAYVNLALWNSHNAALLRGLQLGYDWSVLLFGIALLVALRPSREYDYEWQPRPPGYYLEARKEDVRKMRGLRSKWGRAKRSWTQDSARRAA